MRFLLKVNIPVDAGNAVAKAGKMGEMIQAILADLKPYHPVMLPEDLMKAAPAIERAVRKYT